MIFPEGTKVYWFDPDDGKSNGVYEIIRQVSDEIVLIKSEHSEAEVPFNEIKPLRNVYCCDRCGSVNIEERGWIYVNEQTIAPSDTIDDKFDRWCNNCENHVDFTDLESYLQEKERNDHHGSEKELFSAMQEGTDGG